MGQNAQGKHLGVRPAKGNLRFNAVGRKDGTRELSRVSGKSADWLLSAQQLWACEQVTSPLTLGLLSLH